jgi:hypothetical protein
MESEAGFTEIKISYRWRDEEGNEWFHLKALTKRGAVIFARAVRGAGLSYPLVFIVRRKNKRGRKLTGREHDPKRRDFERFLRETLKVEQEDK